MARGLSIYFIHSSKCDFNNLIYLPVLRSNVLSHHTLMFPRSEENKDKYFKDMIANCDVIVVELTDPDIGFNMELKEALISRKPILALAQKAVGYDPKYQKLLKNIIAYNNEEDFRYYVETFAETYKGVANKKAEENVVVLGNINIGA